MSEQRWQRGIEHRAHHECVKHHADLLFAALDELAALPAREELMQAAVSIDLKTFVVAHIIERIEQIRPHFGMLMAVLPDIIATPELRTYYAERFLQPAEQMLERFVEAHIERGSRVPQNYRLVIRMATAQILGLYLLYIMNDPLVVDAWKNPQMLAEMIGAMLIDSLP